LTLLGGSGACSGILAMTVTLEVERLIKRHGCLTAVDQMSFSVEAGESFDILGPNAAGKVTP